MRQHPHPPATALLLLAVGCTGSKDDCAVGYARNFEGECVPLTASDDTDTTGGGGGDDTGDDTGEASPYDVCSKGAAFASIQAAIDAAKPGDSITICPEIFDEELVLSKPVSLLGAEGSPITRVDARSRAPALIIEGDDIGASTTIARITFRNGDAGPTDQSGGYGGGILIRDASPTLEDVFVEDSVANPAGGSVALIRSSSRIEGLSLKNGAAGQVGGGLYIEGGAPVIRRLYTESNYAPRGAGLYATQAILNLQSAVFFANEGREDGSALLIEDGEGGLIANIAAARQTGAESGCVINTTTNILLYNAAAYSNDGIGICAITAASGYNMSYGNTAGNFLRDGSLTSPGPSDSEDDPFFKDAPTGDLSLRSNSPAIDAGNPDSDFTDLDGSRSDIGAYGGPHASW